MPEVSAAAVPGRLEGKRKERSGADREGAQEPPPAPPAPAVLVLVPVFEGEGPAAEAVAEGKRGAASGMWSSAEPSAACATEADTAAADARSMAEEVRVHWEEALRGPSPSSPLPPSPPAPAAVPCDPVSLACCRSWGSFSLLCCGS